MTKIRIFLAGIIQGSIAEAKIHSQDWREPIKAALARHLPEAEIYCHYSEHPNSISYGLAQIKETLQDGIEKAARSNVVIAFVPSASMGTALEVYEAARRGAVILTISPLRANWVLRAYSDVLLPTLAEFEAFLAAGELKSLLKARGSKTVPDVNL
ncbi:MAG TPA: hypothetical protein DEB40_05145 [Elusimicrobia bacterium]|nr:hypothetical protein [Elusimicrobiota bacterium]HBT61110.1 hypothetical protein [Elusimicrobiota bacterium]